MESNNKNHGCLHCGCNSSILKILENSKYISKTPTSKKDPAPTEIKSIIYSGGTIYPDSQFVPVDAIGIYDDCVVVSGELNGVQNIMKGKYGCYTEYKLKANETLIPGFIDPHVHIVPAALMSSWEDFGPFKRGKLIQNYDLYSIKNKIDSITVKSGDWILGHSVDPSLMPFCKNTGQDGLNQLQSFNCDCLSEMVSDVPLLLLAASQHTIYMNEKGLEAVFYHESNSELRKSYNDSFDEYKAKTKGVLEEEPEMSPALNSIPKSQIEEMLKKLNDNLDDYFYKASSQGITMLYDAGMTKNLREILESYLDTHDSKVRIGCASLYFSDNYKNTPIPEFVPLKKYKDLYQGHFKIVSDGSNQGLTGYQGEVGKQAVPYCCEPVDNSGIFNYDTPSLKNNKYNKMIKSIVDKGWSLMIHANGAKALEYAIDAYKFSKENITQDEKKRRDRIEHCSLLNDKYIKEMVELNISPSFLIGHVGYWGYAFNEAIFEVNTDRLDLCKSSLNSKLRISLHSDNAVTPLGPLRMMEQAVTRIMEQDPNKGILNKKECITPEEALKSVTCDAAWQCFADDWVGSLENGKFADFVILEEDPLSLKDNTKMRDIKVLKTFKGGICTYSSDKDPKQQ